MFVYVASKWLSSVYLEDLAVRYIMCVCVCLHVCGFSDCGFFFFFCNVGGKTTTQPVFWLCVCVWSMRTGGYSDVWPGVSLCIHDGGCDTTMFGCIKLYL